MSPHDYHLSSDYEKTWHHIADQFYLSKYPNCKIIRYHQDSIEDLAFQRKDIDLTLELEGRKIHISEKFRKDDYGDFLIELYSQYPDKRGWMENSEADFVAYYTSAKVYILNKYELTKWYYSQKFGDRLKNEIAELHIDQLNKSSKKKVRFMTALGNEIELSLIQAYNDTGKSQWHTISIAILWEDLKNEGFNIKSYSINNE